MDSWKGRQVGSTYIIFKRKKVNSFVEKQIDRLRDNELVSNTNKYEDEYQINMD